jgi:putative 4-mercaptohistidine N1-methyltranferase
VHLGAALDNRKLESDNPYESESVFNEYMTLHYACPELQMPYESGPHNAVQFPQRCADLVTDWCRRLSIVPGRALDIGCAVGGATFRLAETFEEVVGVDLSERFIKAAQDLKQVHELSYKCKVEADIYCSQKASVSAGSASRVAFRQADACGLPAEYLDFDAVLMANLLCRLPSPAACLRRMCGSRGVVREGGLLVTVSPFTWMPAYTPKDVWLGGYVDQSGVECFSEDGLKQMLGEDFDPLDTQDMPLIIREHRRKYQYIVSQAMVWRRR